VVVTGIALAAINVTLGLSWQSAIVIGFGLAMSSTAIDLAWLGERGELSSPSGRRAFAILLFQDLAVIPLIALLPLLGPDKVSGASGLLLAAKGVDAIAFVIVVSRLVIRPALKLVAASAAARVHRGALLVVIGAALLMEAIGLSMSLGAFLAGVCSPTEFRHELEADVDPFKGLLLGLFFMAVGMSANLALLAAHLRGAGRDARADGRRRSFYVVARLGIRQRRSAAHRGPARTGRRIRLRAVPRRAKRGHPQGGVRGVPRARRDDFHAAGAAVVRRA
jgi:Kef-type K+ transport system membrane component KefB